MNIGIWNTNIHTTNFLTKLNKSILNTITNQWESVYDDCVFNKSLLEITLLKNDLGKIIYESIKVG